MHITQYINPDFIIKTTGIIGITVVIFLETAILFGLFFPGDTLLFTAGFLASQGYMSVLLVWICVMIAAVIGDNVGYYFGEKLGISIFNRDILFLKKETLKSYVEKTQKLFLVYGPKIIIISRFMPIIRTLAPTFAGIGKMPYRTFFTYNLIGGVTWATGFIFAGYYLGKLIPNAEHYLSRIIIVIIVLSITPALVEFIKLRKKN